MPDLHSSQHYKVGEEGNLFATTSQKLFSQVIIVVVIDAISTKLINMQSNNSQYSELSLMSLSLNK